MNYKKIMQLAISAAILLAIGSLDGEKKAEAEPIDPQCNIALQAYYACVDKYGADDASCERLYHVSQAACVSSD